MLSNDEALAELTRPARHLFLSPHYDDIPLSTGATVRQLSDRGLTPETIVVFGSEPEYGQRLSDFAQRMHEVWQLTVDQVIASRFAEESCAAALLGATTRVLPFRDAIYRGHVYLSDDDLFGLPAAAEASLPGEISQALVLEDAVDAGTRIYAPLGVGKHVDHQLVYQAAKDLAVRGWDVWLYEDIPYALKPRALEDRLAEIGNTQGASVQPVASIAADSAWEQKIDAILCYPSQLETVFQHYVGVGTTRNEISEALANYGSSIGEGIVSERFWRFVENSSPEGVDEELPLR